MSQFKARIVTETWVKGTWEEYLHAIDSFKYKKAKGYYYNGHYKIQIPPASKTYQSHHILMMLAANFYATFHHINFNRKDNCFYRQAGHQEAFPDASYYLGENADSVPCDLLNISLEEYAPPDLVIEVAKNTLSDDLGNKRLLYQYLGVSEYWVVDVNNGVVLAFKMSKDKSQSLDTSEVLPHLKISLLNKVLQKVNRSDDSLIQEWPLERQ